MGDGSYTATTCHEEPGTEQRHNRHERPMPVMA